MIEGVDFPRRQRLGRRHYWIAGGVGLALLLALIALAMVLQPSRARPVDLPVRLDPPRARADSPLPLNLPPPDLLRPISPESAVEENAKRPFAARPDSPAAAFKLPAAGATRDRALHCLTQAIYYEAASEGEDGGRAVAQVVLNRMRHPAYPSSVCGVVFQGAERATGCQFTFTCDGSLARVPAASLWKQASRIATEALAGKVFGPVGHATHYHADYVLPYWADSLDKSAKVGRHIFYRLKGSLGSASAFRQRYAGQEPPPLIPVLPQVALDALGTSDDLLALGTEPLQPQAPAGEVIAMAQPVPKLAADIAAGTLIIDEGSSAAGVKRERPKGEACSAGDAGKQLRPLGASDMRAQAPTEGC
ncbi:MAG: cell wall hydrolase [Pseudomonadota bacterium]|nr:cell wall hydrolase [Pseudomonadota bacterium]